MPEDWYEIAVINYSKVILHGRLPDQTEIERVLTDVERLEVEALDAKQQNDMQRLLRHLAKADGRA